MSAEISLCAFLFGRRAYVVFHRLDAETPRRPKRRVDACLTLDDR
jgi:hypothetical protein